MESKKEISTDIIIFTSLIFLFFVFLIIQPTVNTGYITLPLIGDTNELSDPTLIGGIALLVVVWIVVVILYVKLKKKKQLQRLPGLPESEFENIEGANVKEEQKGALTEYELKQLFKEIAPSIGSTQQMPPMPRPGGIDIKDLQLPSPPKTQVQETRLPEQKPEIKIGKPENKLKALMLDLLNKRYTRESIIKYLKKKGYKLTQIAQTIREINNDNLSRYIKQAVSLGYKKDQISKQLLNKGWDQEDIEKMMK